MNEEQLNKILKWLKQKITTMDDYTYISNILREIKEPEHQEAINENDWNKMRNIEKMYASKLENDGMIKGNEIKGGIEVYHIQKILPSVLNYEVYPNNVNSTEIIRIESLLDKKIYKLLEQGFVSLHERHDKHDVILSEIEGKFIGNLSPELQKEFEDIKIFISNESEQNALAIVNELIDWIDISEQSLNREISNIYEKLKKSDDWKLKFKLAIPLLSFIGINISTEFELKLNKITKNIGTKMKKLINR